MWLKKMLVTAVSGYEKRFEIKFGLSVMEFDGRKSRFREGGVTLAIIEAANVADAEAKALARLGEEIYHRPKFSVYLSEVISVTETSENIFWNCLSARYMADRIVAAQ